MAAMPVVCGSIFVLFFILCFFSRLRLGVLLPIGVSVVRLRLGLG